MRNTRGARCECRVQKVGCSTVLYSDWLYFYGIVSINSNISTPNTKTVIEFSDSPINTPYSKMAAILVFFCLLANWPMLPRLMENILSNFEFNNEATRANLQVHVNRRALKWRSLGNNVYRRVLR